MNENWKKVIATTAENSTLALVIAAICGYQEGIGTGLAFAGIALAVNMLYAPILYAYYQRKSRREAEKAARWRREFEADAPNRAARRAIAEAVIAAHQAQAK